MKYISLIACLVFMGLGASGSALAKGVMPPDSYSTEYWFSCGNVENGSDIETRVILKFSDGKLTGRLEHIIDAETHEHKSFQTEVIDGLLSVETMVGWCDGAQSGLTINGSSSDGLRGGVVYRVWRTSDKEEVGAILVDTGTPY